MQTYAVVGLGYVGLELATSLAQKHKVIGFDIDKARITELKKQLDHNHLIKKSLLSAKHITYTNELADLNSATFFLISVPTPSYMHELPDLHPLELACLELAKVIKRDDIIVFESTVYPGATDDICIPILEKHSNLKQGKDFFVGYSPERINPGDKTHTLKNITKIVACADNNALKKIKACYQALCKEVYVVSSIRVAEAIKLLENTQRDVNIAFMNEFSKIMHALNINTAEVVKGAETKWSFAHYMPGFVGGHCIAIDPYYLAYKAKQHGVEPALVLTARKVNDGMVLFVVQSLLKCLIDRKIDYQDLNVGVFGITYKANVSDVRNSLSLNLIHELEEYHFNCHIHDPLYELDKAPCKLESFESMHDLSVAIIVVAHEFYQAKGFNGFLKLLKSPGIIMDIPNMFTENNNNYANIEYWAL
ncbi:MAG: nucleotide sugar dehydrogenase [Legionellales bacterium RIFCSPHIGHO2_12_FULL_37_14]|nr:MAG: nucleotide sugar dehydrogenase [Legionellales bacterium RIFCSPHIGHO2_12_FULL_37_14]